MTSDITTLLALIRDGGTTLLLLVGLLALFRGWVISKSAHLAMIDLIEHECHDKDEIIRRLTETAKTALELARGR